MDMTSYTERAASIEKLAETNVFEAAQEAGKLFAEVWANNPNDYQRGELRSAIGAFQDAIEKLRKQLERC
jgi:hypothetical protein